MAWAGFHFFIFGFTGILDSLDFWIHWIFGFTGFLDSLDFWIQWIFGFCLAPARLVSPGCVPRAACVPRTRPPWLACPPDASPVGRARGSRAGLAPFSSLPLSCDPRRPGMQKRGALDPLTGSTAPRYRVQLPCDLLRPGMQKRGARQIRRSRTAPRYRVQLPFRDDRIGA